MSDDAAVQLGMEFCFSSFELTFLYTVCSSSSWGGKHRTKKESTSVQFFPFSSLGHSGYKLIALCRPQPYLCTNLSYYIPIQLFAVHVDKF